MKVILCGYHWTGCKALEMLLDRGYRVFVYTHKMKNAVADLEGLCRKRGVEYSLDKISVQNMPFSPDIICSVYYRYMIAQEVITVVKGKIFNLHPALLPKYRGCSSLTWAMIMGEKECGYTFHYVDEGCDTGKIIVQNKIKIEDFDTQLTLYNRVMFESMHFFLEAFDKVIEGYPGIEQTGEASYYKRGCPMDGKITDNMNEQLKERLIRAMIYPPYPMAEYKGQEVDTWINYKKLESKD